MLNKLKTIWGAPVLVGATVLAATAVLLSGCSRNSGDGGVANSEDTTGSQVRLERMKKEVGEAVDAAKDYAQFKGEELARKFQGELDLVSKNIDDLTSRATTLTGEARQKMESTVADLRKQQELLTKSLDGMTSASGMALKELGQGADQALKQMREGYDNAKKMLPGQQ